MEKTMGCASSSPSSTRNPIGPRPTRLGITREKSTVDIKHVNMDNLGEDKVLDVKDHTVKMSLSWDFFEGMPSVDMDAACVCFDLDGKYVDSCYYNRLSILDGCITHSGDQRDGKQEGWDEQITVNLHEAADKAQILVFLVLIHDEGRGGTFLNVETAVSSLLDTDGATLVESYMGSGGKNTAHTFSILYYGIDDGDWHYREINANSLGRSLRSVMPVVRKAVSLTIPRLTSAMEKLDQSEVDTLVFFKCVALCENRDYGIVVDKSFSMGGTRWKEAEKAVEFLAPACTEADTDGITLYFFSSPTKFKRYENLRTAKDVEKMWKREQPDGGTDLSHALLETFKDRSKSKPMTLLVITDGEPNNKSSVSTNIINETKKIPDEHALSISFIQVGNDSGAKAFLASLDDDLERLGAKYDIVDTLTCDQLKGMSFNALIESSVTD